MFPKERDRAWSNKAAEWLGQRFLLCKGQMQWKTLQPELREGQLYLQFPSKPAPSSSTACPHGQATATGCELEAPSGWAWCSSEEMLWSHIISEVSKIWEVNSRNNCFPWGCILMVWSAVFPRTQSSCSHGLHVAAWNGEQTEQQFTRAVRAARGEVNMYMKQDFCQHLIL